jgi:hypothetical protein
MVSRPGRTRLSSPYDLDVRWAAGRAKGEGVAWNGYKVHITETCDPPDPTPTGRDTAGRDTAGRDTAGRGTAGRDTAGERPNIIVGVATTDATVPDAAMTEKIHATLAGRELLPAEHYLDSGYPSAALVVDSLRRWGSPCSPRCWPTNPAKPSKPPGTTGPASPSTSTPTRPPARRARPPPAGTRSPNAAPTPS